MARALISVPSRARRGELIEVRALIQHAMETGFRPGADGRVLPRDILRRFRCDFNDGAKSEALIDMELFAAIAANPLVAFSVRAMRSGTLRFEWLGDNGFAHRESVTLVVDE